LDVNKCLKFTITKAQWEMWAGGFSMGAYLDFEIETVGGYRLHYRVHDRSVNNVSRVVSGTMTRAFEQSFQNRNGLDYIEKQHK